MTQPHLVVFDCDGVLVDSEALAARLWSARLQREGYEIEPAVLTRRLLGGTGVDFHEVVAQETGRALPAARIPEWRQEVRRDLIAGMTAVAGAAAMLERLELPRCVSSNSAPDRVRDSLRAARLLHHFAPEALFSAAHVARPKPHPDLYLHAVQRMGVEPAQAVAVEDSVTGVTAARAAGLAVVGFTGAGHHEPGDEARLIAAGAGIVLRRLAELPEQLAAAT